MKHVEKQRKAVPQKTQFFGILAQTDWLLMNYLEAAGTH
jgi:hypothetical protein